MLVILLGIVMEVREEQPLKVPPSILVTLFGMVIEVREEQPLKARFPMFVTLLPMVAEVREEQFEKAPSPIVCTLLGIVTSFICFDRMNKYAGICSTLSPKTTSIMLLLLALVTAETPNNSLTDSQFLAFHTTDVREEHAKAA